MNIDKALVIPGWMTKEELTWLAQQASEHIMIAEVGSWFGRSARAMADNTEGRVFCVDHWLGSEYSTSVSDWFITNLVSHSGGPVEVFNKFKMNVHDLLGTRIVPIKSSSVEAARLFQERTFDMVFIDGRHEADSVRQDIQLWSRLLADGGLICGHDYTDTCSVKPVVDEMIPERNIVEGTSIWWDIVHWKEETEKPMAQGA